MVITIILVTQARLGGALQAAESTQRRCLEDFTEAAAFVQDIYIYIYMTCVYIYIYIYIHIYIYIYIMCIYMFQDEFISFDGTLTTIYEGEDNASKRRRSHIS